MVHTFHRSHIERALFTVPPESIEIELENLYSTEILHSSTKT